jgi:hypothetical protein
MTPSAMRSVVVLPAPLGPRKPVMSPRRALQVTFFTASLPPKLFVSPSSSSA